MAVLGFTRRRPLACYFSVVYLLSGVALVVIGVPKLDGAAQRSMLPLVVFPVMVAGIGLTGIALTAVTGAGRACGSYAPVPPPCGAAVAGGSADPAGGDPRRTPRWWTPSVRPARTAAGVHPDCQPYVTAVTRAGPDQLQITERDWVSLGVPPDRRI